MPAASDYILVSGSERFVWGPRCEAEPLSLYRVVRYVRATKETDEEE
jgi:hypothetical protein